jgi:hypothetical protein
MLFPQEVPITQVAHLRKQQQLCLLQTAVKILLKASIGPALSFLQPMDGEKILEMVCKLVLLLKKPTATELEPFAELQFNF